MLKTKEKRNTKQKRAVREYLSSTFSHPSAEKVYKEVSKKLPNISKATVYRILRDFKKDNIIQEIPADVSRWDYNNNPHPHFICTECDKMIDLEREFNMPNAKDLEVGQVCDCRVVFSGICKECKN